MAQPKPEREKLDEILRLVDQLSPEEHEQLAEEMKLQWLRRELGKAEDELRRGEGVPAEQVFAELRERNKAFREKGGTV
jgi:DNA relaxase NicK